MIRPPPISTLFPYTTLFRSHYKSYHRKVRLKPYCSGLRLPIKPAITKKQNGCSIPSAAPKPMRQTFNSERSEEHTSELQSHSDLVCRLLLEKKKKKS